MSTWAEQQAESIARYQDSSYEADGTIGELFGGFIAVTLDRTGPVIDLGCGLHPLEPHYVKQLALPNFLGIEPLETPVARDYACLSGVTAEALPLPNDHANGAIFATSLDHMENPRKAIQEVLRVLKPGAPLYFWLGVHDPFILAECKTFGNVHNHARSWRKWARIIAAPVEHLKLILDMTRRRRDLANGTPLDTAHLRYHTTTEIDAELAGYGLSIVRRVLVPGSASLFVEARETAEK
jgi:SAM-dependent methyltransferase